MILRACGVYLLHLGVLKGEPGEIMMISSNFPEFEKFLNCRERGYGRLFSQGACKSFIFVCFF
eukprot:UN24042